MSLRTTPANPAHGWHLDRARQERARELAEGRARPSRPATDADLGFAPLDEADPDLLEGYLPGPVPWRRLSFAEVQTAADHPDARIRARARREYNRRRYGK